MDKVFKVKLYLLLHIKKKVKEKEENFLTNNPSLHESNSIQHFVNITK